MVALMLMTFGALLAFRDQDFATEIYQGVAGIVFQTSTKAQRLLLQCQTQKAHLEHPQEEMQCSLPLTSFFVRRDDRVEADDVWLCPGLC